MNNEPAFPHTKMTGHKDYAGGMTLRDYFAAQALAGLYTQERTITGHKWAAREAYSAADAMLAARIPQESEEAKS